MNLQQLMITSGTRADIINILDEQSPPEIRGSWLIDPHMHLTFVSHLVPGIGIEVKEIVGKTGDEIKALIACRMEL